MDMIYGQPAGNLAAMMRHLVRATELEGDHEGLTPLQWSALQYLGLANGISRTVSGFAAYNATSKGTASQVIKSLVDKDLVKRVRRPRDARSAELVLTAGGQRLVEEGGDSHLATAIGALSDADRQQLEAVMTRLMGQLRAPRGRVQLGSCHDCCHLDARKGSPLCCRTGSRLDEAELNSLCAAHTPRESRRD